MIIQIEKILHPDESSHILTTHHLLIDFANCLSCCLEFFLEGGWSSHDPRQGIHGHPMVIHFWITVIHDYMETTRAWAQWKSISVQSYLQQVWFDHSTSTSSDALAMPILHDLPLGGIQELQCLVSSELVSLCPAVVDTRKGFAWNPTCPCNS